MLKIVDKPSLPKETFQTEAAPQLLAQAVRVHLANQRQGNQNAKTRAEISRTRHKLYKQKGTGGARHGDRKAPIFVGGGVTFAPKPRDYSLSLSAKMKKAALFGALTTRVKNENLQVVSGLDKLTGKTAELAEFLKDKTKEKKDERWLIITDIVRENVYRAARNIAGVTILPFNQLNTYEVLNADQVLLMEEILPIINSMKSIKSVTPVTPLAKPEKPKTTEITKTVKKAKKISKPTKVLRKTAKIKKSQT